MLWNLQFMTHILILLYQVYEIFYSIFKFGAGRFKKKPLEQNQSMHGIWVIFQHLFGAKKNRKIVKKIQKI